MIWCILYFGLCFLSYYLIYKFVEWVFPHGFYKRQKKWTVSVIMSVLFTFGIYYICRNHVPETFMINLAIPIIVFAAAYEF